MKTERSSFALIATLLLIVLMITTGAALSTAAGVEAVIADRQARTGMHELAVESALVVIAARLADTDAGARVLGDLDRRGSHHLGLHTGQVHVYCRITDDGAKFNPNLFPRPDQANLLARKLIMLATRSGLQAAALNPRPIVTEYGSTPGRRYASLDQIVDGDGALVHHWQIADYQRPNFAWSDVLTCWGDGRVDLRRAGRDALEAALDDLAPGLSSKLLAARPAQPGVNYLQAALERVDAGIRPQVAQRITGNAHRYAVRLNTDIEGDVRRWYVVATIKNSKAIVLHRSRVTW